LEVPATDVSPEHLESDQETHPSDMEETAEKNIVIADKQDLFYIIAHVMEDDVIFSIDPEASVSAGDLYSLLFPDGEEAGLLIVSEVDETYAVARILSADKDPRPGDKVREAARAGIEATLYGGGILRRNFDNSYIPMAGLKLALAKGVFYTRPVLELGFPFARVHPDLSSSSATPFTVLVGAEITNIYMGRFQLASAMLLGMGLAYMKKDAQEAFDTTKTFQKTHTAGKIALSLSFLFTRHLKLAAEVGMFVLLDIGTALSDVSPEYFGRAGVPYATLGLTLR